MKTIPKELYDRLDELGIIPNEVRSGNVGKSDYSKHIIQPWAIWQDYNLNPWDADIVKRVLRTKEGDSRVMDYQKIIHICKERIRQLEKLEKTNNMEKRFTKEEIKERVFGAIKEVLFLQNGEVKMGSKLKQDFNADSLDLIELAMSLQRDFNIIIPDNKMYAMGSGTVEDICIMVEQIIDAE